MVRQHIQNLTEPSFIHPYAQVVPKKWPLPFNTTDGEYAFRWVRSRIYDNWRQYGKLSLSRLVVMLEVPTSNLQNNMTKRCIELAFSIGPTRYVFSRFCDCFQSSMLSKLIFSKLVMFSSPITHPVNVQDHSRIAVAWVPEHPLLAQFSATVSRLSFRYSLISRIKARLPH